MTTKTQKITWEAWNNQRMKNIPLTKLSFWREFGLEPSKIPLSCVVRAMESINLLKDWQAFFNDGFSFKLFKKTDLKKAFEESYTIYSSNFPLKNYLDANLIIKNASKEYSNAFQILKLWKDHGFDLNFKTRGEPPLFYLANVFYSKINSKKDYQSAFILYEELGIDLSARNKKGNMLVHHAALAGNWLLVESLVDYNPAFFQAEGEHNRNLVEFIEKKIHRDKSAGRSPSKAVGGILTRLEKNSLKKTLPEASDKKTSKSRI